MQLDEQQILSFSRELWASHLGLNIQPEAESDTAEGEKTWSACVNVSGPWQGAIVLECPESVVRHAAAMLFATDGDNASEEDIEDALGELTSMVGRKMLTLFPESSKLSRPSVLDESKRSISGMSDVDEFKLNCEGRPVRIAVLEKETEQAAAS